MNKMLTDNNHKKSRLRKQIPKIEKMEINGIPAGLAKTKKIIRTEHDKEIQFLKICKQIQLYDFKIERADKQRADRRLQRKLNTDSKK